MSTERVSNRGSWYLLTGTLIGLALGLLVAWILFPVEYVDTSPASLRPDFKDQYRSMIASAFLATGELGRAQSRLSLLDDADPVQALTLQSQSALSAGDPDGSAYALARLADALKLSPTGVSILPTSTPASATQPLLSGATVTPAHPPASMITPVSSPTPRPTRTPTPTVGAAYILIKQEDSCETNLPEGLLQVEVQDAAGRPVPGAEIILAWQGGEEHFFTGLKPELGDGYADFTMTPDTVYTIQLASGGQLVSNLSAPSCRTSAGDNYHGGVRLLFQQP